MCAAGRLVEIIISMVIFALQVCLNKLEDLQLAMVIARLYEGERDPTPPSLKRLLYEVS